MFFWEFAFCLFVSYAYICTWIERHLKETVLWSNLFANGRNNSHQCRARLHGVKSFDRFQTLPNKTQQHPTKCYRVCKRTQHVTSNNVGNMPFAISFAYICTWIGQYLEETALWENITWSEMQRQNCILTNWSTQFKRLRTFIFRMLLFQRDFHGSGSREKELLRKTPTLGIQNFYGIIDW